LARTKGALNKDSFDAKRIAAEIGEDPLRVIGYIMTGDWKALKLPSPTVTKFSSRGEAYEESAITIGHRLTAASAFAEYVYSKRKSIEIIQEPNPTPKNTKRFSFEEFCENAGYPTPYPKQIEMMEFGMNSEGARMILGARGYGKTDYVVILGLAYRIYLDQAFSSLIVTKSEERNTAMLDEISKALEANGLSLEKKNSSCLRVSGLHGKDNSVSALTVGASSIRGRHPHIVVMDDPVTEEDVSEATRKRVQRVYNEVSKLCQNVLVIGQPVHKYDLYETLRPLLNRMEVPHGSIPELDHDLVAQRLAGVDEASIQASYFLKVLNEGATPFERIRTMDRFPSGDSAVAFIDPSFEGGDYTAITILKSWMEGVAVVGFTYKRAWNHCLDEINEKLIKYSVKRLCFETNSLGDQPIEVLRKVFKNCGVVGKKSNTNKHSRIMSAGTFAHLIHLSKESDTTYQDQVIKYEYKSKHDDAPDSLASCLEWIGLIRGKQ